jgi:hypothetical protein
MHRSWNPNLLGAVAGEETQLVNAALKIWLK